MASGGIPVDTGFHRNHKISHRNPSGGVFLSTGRDSLGKTLPEGLPVTQNPTGRVSALPVSLPAGTLRGGVKYVGGHLKTSFPTYICTDTPV